MSSNNTNLKVLASHFLAVSSNTKLRVLDCQFIAVSSNTNLKGTEFPFSCSVQQYKYETYHFCQPGGGQLAKVLEQNKELFPAQIQTDQIRNFLLPLRQQSLDVCINITYIQCIRKFLAKFFLTAEFLRIFIYTFLYVFKICIRNFTKILSTHLGTDSTILFNFF